MYTCASCLLQNSEHARHKSMVLCKPSRISKGHHQATRLKHHVQLTYQIIAEQENSFLFSWNGEKNNGPNSRKHGSDSNDQRFLLPFCCNPGRADDRNNLYDPKWDVE